MRNKLHLHIPTPCHEEWNNMKPVQQGRYCFSCQKSVVDFTNMSDSEIINFFKKPSTGSVCGRFQDHQLNRDILEPRKSLPWIKYFFQFTLPAFLISMKAEAQQGKIKVTAEISSSSIKGDTELIGKQNNYSIPGEIKGRVIDEEGNPIQYSTVVVKGTNRGVLTDSLGNFSIKLIYTDRIMTLSIGCVGFQSKERIVDLRKPTVSSDFVIDLTLSPKTLGEVSVTAGNDYKKGKLAVGFSAVTCTGRLIDASKSFFNKFSIYPNPVISGNSVVIESKKLKEDIYSVQIINLAGQTIHNEIITITGKQRLYMKIPALSAGAYFLKLTAKNSGKSFSEKIIVQ